MGAVIAIIGAIARTHLRETPEFVDAKRQLKKSLELASHKIDINTEKLENNLAWKEKVKQKNSLALFLIQCAWSICFYIIYFHCGNVLKTNFNFTSEEVIHQNFIVSIFQVLGFALWTYLSCYVYPLTLLKYKVVIFTLIALILPYSLSTITTSSGVLIMQILLVMFSLTYSSAMPIFYKHFPVFKRFTYASFIYALSRAFIYAITSFGLIYLTKYFGHLGIIVVTIPVVIGFIWGVLHFEKLEKETGNYSIKTLYNFGFQKAQ